MELQRIDNLVIKTVIIGQKAQPKRKEEKEGRREENNSTKHTSPTICAILTLYASPQLPLG